MVVMELVSQQLDEYKNDGVISTLNEILLGQIWVCWLVYSGGATHMGEGGGGGNSPQIFKNLFYSIYIIYILKNVACKN